MKTNDNQQSNGSYKVYLPRLKQWVEVTKEQYYGYYRDIWATRDRAQNHGQCQCPRGRTWTCEPLPRLPVDCDNDQSEDASDWVTPADIADAFPLSPLPSITAVTT